MQGPELRRRRLALGLSQAELATELEVTKNTVARWERDEVAIRHPGMLRACLEDIEAEHARRIQVDPEYARARARGPRPGRRAGERSQ